MQELFADPAHWTQNSNARNAQGNKVSIDDPAARSFCLLGGIERVYSARSKADRRLIADRCHDYAAQHSGGDTTSFVTWNDDPGRTVRDIQKMCTELGV